MKQQSSGPIIPNKKILKQETRENKWMNERCIYFNLSAILLIASLTMVNMLLVNINGLITCKYTNQISYILTLTMIVYGNKFNIYKAIYKSTLQILQTFKLITHSKFWCYNDSHRFIM